MIIGMYSTLPSIMGQSPTRLPRRLQFSAGHHTSHYSCENTPVLQNFLVQGVIGIRTLSEYRFRLSREVQNLLRRQPPNFLPNAVEATVSCSISTVSIYRSVISAHRLSPFTSITTLVLSVDHIDVGTWGSIIQEVSTSNQRMATRCVKSSLGSNLEVLERTDAEPGFHVVLISRVVNKTHRMVMPGVSFKNPSRRAASSKSTQFSYLNVLTAGSKCTIEPIRALFYVVGPTEGTHRLLARPRY